MELRSTQSNWTCRKANWKALTLRAQYINRYGEPAQHCTIVASSTNLAYYRVLPVQIKLPLYSTLGTVFQLSKKSSSHVPITPVRTYYFWMPFKCNIIQLELPHLIYCEKNKLLGLKYKNSGRRSAASWNKKPMCLFSISILHFQSMCCTHKSSNISLAFYKTRQTLFLIRFVIKNGSYNVSYLFLQYIASR